MIEAHSDGDKHETSLSVSAASHIKEALTFTEKVVLSRKPFDKEEMDEKKALFMSVSGEVGLSKLQKSWREYIARREQETARAHEAGSEATEASL